MESKVFVSTTPFGTVSDKPIKVLEEAGIRVQINPTGRRLTPGELREFIADSDYLIAGTEIITPDVLDVNPNLRLISRVGVGLDNIPFDEVNKRGIKIAYTPDAPTLAVAELCLGFLVDCARGFSANDRNIRQGRWDKYMGQLLEGKTLGIIGFGRIGKVFSKIIQPLNLKVIANDLVEDRDFARIYGIEFVSKDDIYSRSDFISLNLSCSSTSSHLINSSVFKKMKRSAYLINTSRGQVVDEEALYQALKNKSISGAAIDVYDDEPYSGKLTELENIILTAHIGAATNESRYLMELGAAEEVVRFHRGEPLKNMILNS